MILLGLEKNGKATQCFKNGSFTCQRELSCEELNLYELKRGICKDLNISRGPIHQSGVPLSLLQMPLRNQGWKRRKKKRQNQKKAQFQSVISCFDNAAVQRFDEGPAATKITPLPVSQLFSLFFNKDKGVRKCAVGTNTTGLHNIYH